MPGWNGAGVFVLPYSMVAEAAAGVKILASHQDTQWNAVKAGLENCLTLDGQNSPSVDIPWNSKKITGLATPVNNTDAANKAYVDSVAASEWVPEAFSVQWVSASSFRVNGTDATTRYHQGRRLKITHNTGASTAYATVLLSTFSTNTTVTVETDTAAALVSTVTAVSYGELSYSNPSYLDPRTSVVALLSSTTFGVTAPVIRVPLDLGYLDPTTEFSGVTHKVTIRRHGYYLISAVVTWNVTTAGTAYASIRQNGSELVVVRQYLPVNANPLSLVVPSSVMYFDKGDLVDLYFGGIAGDLMGDTYIRYTCLNVARVP